MAIEFRRDGPWELPEGWVWTRAGDVLPLEYGKGLPERLRDTSGEFPVYGSAGVVGTHSKSLVEKPCLIIARKGSVGAIFEETRPCWPIDTVYYARDSAALSRRFAYWFFSFWRLDRLDQSTAVPSLSRDNYNDVLIPIAPLSEQRRIVARIDELFTEIADGETALTRARDDLDTWRRALLKAAVTGELTREWRTTNLPNESGSDVIQRIKKMITATVRPLVRRNRKSAEQDGVEVDLATLPELPASWAWSRIGEIGEVSGGLTKNPDRSSIARKLPYLRVANVQYGELDLSDVHQIGVHESEFERVRLRANDLLVVEGNGSVDQIGRCAIWTNEIDPCVHQNHIIKVRIADAKLAFWIFHWLMSPHGRQLVTRVASSTSGLHTLSISKIEAMPVPICPTVERDQIISILDDGPDHGSTVEIELAEGDGSLSSLRQSVLRTAFEGRLVAQDPRDEPAKRLMARLGDKREIPPSSRRKQNYRAAVIAE